MPETSRRVPSSDALIAAIDRAFDGVSPPGPGHRTLYEAELADNYGHDADRPHPPAHRGRWQDIPMQELADCGWAFAHLDAAGVHYYVPAILTRYLRWWATDDDGTVAHLQLFGSVHFMLSASTSYELREHQRAYLSRFTAVQRRAISGFMTLTSEGSDEAGAWARAVAHDDSGNPGDWFDAFWPERARPEAAAVVALIETAFGVQAEAGRPPSLDWNERLSASTPQDFAASLPTQMLWALRNPNHPDVQAVVQGIQEALHPMWGQPAQPAIRARLAILDWPRRRAVSAFVDACIDREPVRAMWRSAAEHGGEDWFEWLKAP